MKIDKLNWFLLIILACIWGSSFILMKRGMTSLSGDSIFNDTQVAALRMTIASTVLLPFAWKSIRKIKSLKIWLMLAIVGFSGNFFPAFLFTYAETGISSGLTGMLNSFTPIFAIIIGSVVFQDKLSVYQVVGIVLGTIGIIGLTITGASVDLSGGVIYVLAVVVATLFYAISLNTIKFTLQDYSGVEITSLAFLTVMVPALVLMFISGTPVVIAENEFAFQGLGFIAILSVVGTAFAVYLFNVLIARSTVVFSSSVTYLIPLVAVAIGLLDGEKITFAQVLSMLVVLLGVFVANLLPKLLARRENNLIKSNKNKA